MTIKVATKEVSMQMADAMQSDDKDKIALAWSAFADCIANQVRSDFRASQGNGDAEALADRGYRKLTGAEQRWYERVSSALKSKNPKQEFIDILASDEKDDVMPETIIEDVLRYLQENRPLLSKVRMQYVGFSTKWVINDNSVQRGAWGEIDAKIVTEIKGAIKILDVEQAKYSAFCIIPIDILDMGPQFLDSFIRATLAEATGLGLEEAIVAGNGVNMPCGMMRNPNGVFDQTNGYPEKEAIKVTSFAPVEYGNIVAKVSRTEKDKERQFDKVYILCSMTDYLTKIMPATTVLTPNVGYVSNLFPFPTEVIPCSAVPHGKCVLGVLDDYTLAVGGNKNGVIEYDDSIGFLDHTRAFRIVQHAAGRAYDNTSFIVLDISNLDPAYITVKNVDATPTA